MTTGAAPEGDGGIVTCDACPVLCRIRPGRAGACDRYGNVDGALVRMDPMVLAQTIRPAARSVPGRLTVHFSARGGHVGFPSGIDLGFPGRPGLMRQVVGWLDAALRAGLAA